LTRTQEGRGSLVQEKKKIDVRIAVQEDRTKLKIASANSSLTIMSPIIIGKRG